MPQSVSSKSLVRSAKKEAREAEKKEEDKPLAKVRRKCLAKLKLNHLTSLPALYYSLLHLFLLHPMKPVAALVFLADRWTAAAAAASRDLFAAVLDSRLVNAI